VYRPIAALPDCFEYEAMASIDLMVAAAIRKNALDLKDMMQHARKRHPDEEALLIFVQTAKPRESYVYGYSDRRASRSVMELARYLQTSGLILLVQKREKKGFAYTAIRTSKSNKIGSI